MASQWWYASYRYQQAHEPSMWHQQVKPRFHIRTEALTARGVLGLPGGWSPEQRFVGGGGTSMNAVSLHSRSSGGYGGMNKAVIASIRCFAMVGDASVIATARWMVEVVFLSAAACISLSMVQRLSPCLSRIRNGVMLHDGFLMKDLTVACWQKIATAEKVAIAGLKEYSAHGVTKRHKGGSYALSPLLIIRHRATYQRGRPGCKDRVWCL